MGYPTTSTLLSWITFLPLAGVGLILILACAKNAFGGSKEFLDNASRAIGLAKNRLPLAQRVPVFAVQGPLDAHRFNETVGRAFKRDAVNSFHETGFQYDDRGLWHQRSVK